MDTEDEEEICFKNECSNDGAMKKDDKPINEGVLAYLLANHLWIFAIWLIPLSVFYDIFWWFRARFVYWLCRSNAHLRHDEKVKSTSVKFCRPSMLTFALFERWKKFRSKWRNGKSLDVISQCALQDQVGSQSHCNANYTRIGCTM